MALSKLGFYSRSYLNHPLGDLLDILAKDHFIYTLLHKYCHLLISRCNFEKMCITRKCQQTLFCKQTSQAISKSSVFTKNQKVAILVLHSGFFSRITLNLSYSTCPVVSVPISISFFILFFHRKL